MYSCTKNIKLCQLVIIIYNGNVTKKIYTQKPRVRDNLAVEWDRNREKIRRVMTPKK